MTTLVDGIATAASAELGAIGMLGLSPIVVGDAFAMTNIATNAGKSRKRRMGLSDAVSNWLFESSVKLFGSGNRRTGVDGCFSNALI